MVELCLMIAFAAGIATLILALAGKLPTAADLTRPWLGPYRLWHLAMAVVVGALLVATFQAGPRDGGFPALLLAVVVAVLFLRSWRHEFLFLMNLRDDDFPGRYDKAIWAALLITLGPIGLWAFRAYHLAHWPELDGVPAGAKRPAPEVF